MENTQIKLSETVMVIDVVRGEKRNVSICGRPEND